MKKTLYILSVIIFAFMSCSDNNDEPTKRPDPSEEINPYKTGIDLSSSKFVKWDNKGIENNYFMLGYGFDVTGKYAHPAWIRNKIIDVDKYAEDKDGLVTLFRTLSGSAEIMYAGTKQESLTRLASLAGFKENEIPKYKNLFKATFASTFDDDTSFPDLDYYYSGYSSTHAVYLARFYYNERYALKYLTDEFKLALQTKSAEDIIKEYGTHIMKEVSVGERIDYLYRCTSSDAKVVNSWSGYNAYYYFQIPSSGLTVYKPDKEKPLKENIYIEVVDGTKPSPNAWMLDITNYKKDPIVFEGWKNISDANLTLVYFNDNGLIPIYDLVTDPEKKEALKKAYVKYLSE